MKAWDMIMCVVMAFVSLTAIILADEYGKYVFYTLTFVALFVIRVEVQRIREAQK